MHIECTRQPGTGDGAYVISDGYFYVYCVDRLPITPRDALAVARAPVADVVRAALDYETVVSWAKDDNGSWTEPGCRGLARALDHPHEGGIGAFSVAYNVVRRTSILISTDWGRSDPIDLFASPDGLTWRTGQPIPHDQAEAVSMTIIGTGSDPHETDAQCYMYVAASPHVGREVDTTRARKSLSLTNPALPVAPPCQSWWCLRPQLAVLP